MLHKLQKYQEDFEPELQEFLMLIKSNVGGACVQDDMLVPSVQFLASVNLATGEVSQEKGRLEWMIPKEKDRKGWGFDLKENIIYRVKVRKHKEQEKQPDRMAYIYNCYLLIEIMESNVSHPALNPIQTERSKEGIIKDPVLGTFVLDRELSWFEGEVNWLGETCTVNLKTDEEDGNRAEKALQVFKQFYVDVAKWDQKFRSFAAEKLTELANDWLQDTVEEEEEEPEAITKEQFAKRMIISDLNVNRDGDLTLYYDDDDMFWGHVIEIEANINGKISSADIAG